MGKEKLLALVVGVPVGTYMWYKSLQREPAATGFITGLLTMPVFKLVSDMAHELRRERPVPTGWGR